MYAYGALSIVFAAVLWSVDGLFRQSLYTVPSMLVVTLEHALGALLYAPLVAIGWKHVRAVRASHWAILVGTCAISGVLALFLYTKALAYVGFVPLSVVILLQKLQPLFTIASASVVLRERITPRFVATAIVAGAGAYLVTFGLHVPAWNDDRATILAALMALGATACWGSSTVFSKFLLTETPARIVTGLRMALTTLIAAALSLVLGHLPVALELEPAQWQALLLIACTTGGVALGIYYWGLRRVPASHACIYELTWPVSAIAIDYFYHGVLLTLSQLLGAVVLIGAMLSLPRRQA